MVLGLTEKLTLFDIRIKETKIDFVPTWDYNEYMKLIHYFV